MRREPRSVVIQFLVLLLGLLVLATSSYGDASRLEKENSPYLKLHAKNPIDWYPWGKEAFSTADAENKLVFLSIGYTACYWCHVMESETFRDPEVANFLNKHFVSIKVDREERPDIDALYMEAVHRLRGKGGWPLNVFLTPDRKPFFGLSYVPREQFLALVERVVRMRTEQKGRISDIANKLSDALVETPGTSGGVVLSDAEIVKAVDWFAESFDKSFGGFGPAPKFPQSYQYIFLLRAADRLNKPIARNMAVSTLDAMAEGGLFDQLGGGFHRYSVDRKWRVPHFEKMLYDNALLAWTYMDAGAVLNNSTYKRVAKDTLDFILRDLSSTDGSFISSLGAGDVGLEGEYYTWKESELAEVLTESEYTEMRNVFDVNEKGNFERGRNILYLKGSSTLTDLASESIKRIRKKLLVLRQSRPHPHRDTKIITAWNGLAIAAFASGSRKLGEERFLEAARRVAVFLRKNLWKNGRLYRISGPNGPEIEGYLEDYAYLIWGLIELYQADDNPNWILWAFELQNLQDKLFASSQPGAYFFDSARDELMIARTKIFYDRALPSAGGVAAYNLQRLFQFNFNRQYRKRSEQVISFQLGASQASIGSQAMALMALDYSLANPKELVVVGDKRSQSVREIRKLFNASRNPYAVSAFGSPAGVDDMTVLPLFRGKKLLNSLPTFYVCEVGRCKAPTNDKDIAVGQLEARTH